MSSLPSSESRAVRKSTIFAYRSGGVLLFVVSLHGCGLFGLLSGDCGSVLSVSGTVTEAGTGVPLADLYVGGRSFTQDEETDYVSPFTSSGSPNVPPTSSEGAFRIDLSGPLGPCVGDPIPFPTPDRIELMVIRGTCETPFTIEVNEDTVVDLSFPNDTLELKDPVLVPPCDATTTP